MFEIMNHCFSPAIDSEGSLRPPPICGPIMVWPSGETGIAALLQARAGRPSSGHWDARCESEQSKAFQGDGHGVNI
jgi:hypothetical protein